ncbi:MAG TPA: protein kinase [Anaerolineales bacterium]|nr:protein kinase [Anaerolineales bacterium]
MALTTGELLSNRYRIVKLLGEGGFGAVYRAWDVSLKKAVALKENLDISPEAQRQFEREATVLAGLTHTNLPRVTDHFVIPGQGQYLVMDFVEGMDLATLVQSQGAVTPAQAIPWMLQIAGALEYLHAQPSPIIHRDIKPANIRIRLDGSAVLGDFGLVKVYDARLRTTIGARAVTPGYAPPEQYGQGTTDPRTDLYALGATLYTLLTGSEPPESVQRMAGTPLTPPHQLNAQIPVATGRVIERAMALQPNQRYQTVTEFKNALLATVSQPIPVQPVSGSYPGAVQYSPLAPPSIATPLVNPPSGPVRGRSAGWMLWVLIPFALLGLLALLGGGGYLVTSPLRPTPTARVITATPDRSATQEAEATAEALVAELESLRVQGTSLAQTVTVQQQDLAAYQVMLEQSMAEVESLRSTVVAGGSSGPTPVSGNLCPGAPSLYLNQIYSNSFAAGDSHCLILSVNSGSTYFVTVGGSFDSTMTLYDANWNELDSNDDGGPGVCPAIGFTAAHNGNYYAILNGYHSSSTGDYQVLFRNTPLDDAFLNEEWLEANQTMRGVIYESTWLELPSLNYRARGRMYYYYNGIAGQTIQIDVFGPSINSQIDPYVELYDTFGNLLASDDDSGIDYDSQLIYTLPVNSGYYIAVRSLGDRFGDDSTYFYDLLVTIP